LDQRIIETYDAYVHLHFGRRLFLDRLAKYTGSRAVAGLPFLQSNYALAATDDDVRIRTHRVTIPGATTKKQRT
jgi:carboxymethylenebutenolidase